MDKWFIHFEKKNANYTYNICKASLHADAVVPHGPKKKNCTNKRVCVVI